MAKTATTDRDTATIWSGDVLDWCPQCTWWVLVDELTGGLCVWCRGTVCGG